MPTKEMKYHNKKCSTLKKKQKKWKTSKRPDNYKAKWYQYFTLNVNGLTTPIKKQRLAD